MKITIFKQTIAVNSLYPFKTQKELFLNWLDKHSLFFIILLCIILFILIVLSILVLKDCFTIESGVFRNFLINGV